MHKPEYGMQGFEGRINWTKPAIWRLWRDTAKVGNTKGRKEDSGGAHSLRGNTSPPVLLSFWESMFLSMAFSAWR